MDDLTMMSNKKLLILAITCLTFSNSIFALDVDAGDYDTAPSGTSLALLYLQHAERNNLYDNSNKVVTNSGLDTNIGILRFVHYTDYNNILIAPQVLIPFGQLKGKGDLSEVGTSNGLGDIILSTAIWLHNDQENKQYWGFTPYLYIPTGKYDQEDGLNIGENRYKLTLQSGYSTRLLSNLAWDITGDITLYGDNNEFSENSELKQEMGFQVQTSVRYFLNDKFDLRTGLSYQDAGDTEVDNITTKSYKQSKFWLGTGINLSQNSNLILTYGKDLNVSNGFKINDNINLRLLYAF